MLYRLIACTNPIPAFIADMGGELNPPEVVGEIIAESLSPLPGLRLRDLPAPDLDALEHIITVFEGEGLFADEVLCAEDVGVREYRIHFGDGTNPMGTARLHFRLCDPSNVPLVRFFGPADRFARSFGLVEGG